MDLLKQWDEIDQIASEEDRSRFLAYVMPFAEQVEKAIREKRFPEKTFGAKEAVFALLVELASIKGPMSEGAYSFLASAGDVFSFSKKSREELTRYGILLRGKERSHFVQALTLALRLRKSAEVEEEYDAFVKGLWLLVYQDLPLSEEQYQAIYRYVDPRKDRYPDSLEAAFRDEGR